MKSKCQFIKRKNFEPCGHPQKFRSSFCKKHAKHFKSKSNEKIIDELAIAMRDCVDVSDEKKIEANLDLSKWAKFKNLFNELINRGYKHEEILSSIKSIQESKGFMDDIFNEIGLDPKWKKFEKLVSTLHLIDSEDAILKYDDTIIGKRTGRKRQIDISIKFKHSFYSYLLVIECKNYKSNVPISEVEAFKTKLEDVGADKGIMVASKGFQQGAIETAKAYGIELFTLIEEKSEWVKKLNDFSINLPFPRDISFDHPSIPKNQQDTEPRSAGFAEILFYENNTKPPKSLADIIMDVCSSALDMKLQLPSKVDIKFDKQYMMKIPSYDKYIPVYGMKCTLVQYQYKESKEIDIPPSILQYKYIDIINEKTHIIPIEKLNSELIIDKSQPS